MPIKCSAIAKSGRRCTTPVVTGKALCWMHDPASAEGRREASRKGGTARSNKARAAKLVPDALTPDELAGLLSHLFKRVLIGETEPRIATACAALARVLMDLRSANELEERLSALEAQARVDTRWRA